MNKKTKLNIKDFIKKPFHWHFLVIGYQSIEGTNYHETAEIEISEAGTEEEAIEIAKQTIKRNHYAVRKAWQCSKCLNSEEMLKVLKKMV